MASVFQKRGRWYLRFKDRDGHWTKQASAARNRTEAKRLAGEAERLEERYRLGMESPRPVAPPLREALGWWLETYVKGKPSYEKIKHPVELHLLTSKLADMPLDRITPGDVEQLLQEKSRTVGAKKKPLGPQSLNHLRGFLHRTFTAAIKKRMVAGPNPIDEVAVWKMRKRREHDFLRPHEVIPVLRAVAPRYRNLFACAIYAGLRKGELAGLRKEDVDLDYQTITVRHSYDRDTTKGGHADTLPIASELVPYLADAIARSKCALVFPEPKNKMLRPDAQLQIVLRRALRRAGICTGYQHKCRFKGCGLVEVHGDAEPRRCPRHNHLLWPAGIVRPIRFHDLRHTTGSLLAMAGVDTPALQKILRLRVPRLTMSTYVHLTPGYLRNEIDRLTFGPLGSESQGVSVEADAVLVPRLSPGAPRHGFEGSDDHSDPHEFPEIPAERDIGFEPTTFSLGS
jgi:integrase